MRNISFLFVNSIFYITFAAMKLSVIIPVYRVEATLNRCLESVLAQNVEDMEVILVDDGSPDNSPVMCDEWAVKDVRICVIHKINGGLSDARNAGLDIAKGEYVTFVDSDDYLLPDTYGPLLNMIGTCDIIEFSVADRLALQDCCYDDMSKYWLESQAYSHAYAWNKIYRRSLFDGIYFPKGEIFEDVIMLPKLLRQAQRVMTTSKGFYCYTFNKQGITATTGGDGLIALLDAHLHSGMPVDDAYYMYLVNIQMDIWECIRGPFLLKKRKVRTTGLKFKTKLKALLLNVIDIKRLCKLNMMFHMVKKPSRW